MKYIIYARKSTEEDDRQVLSIEAQLVELKEFAAKEKLEIVPQNQKKMLTVKLILESRSIEFFSQSGDSAGGGSHRSSWRFKFPQKTSGQGNIK